VLIALGGGTHGRALAALVASAIARRVPDVRIRAAAGFAAHGRQPELARGHWVEAPDGLAAELGSATVAVTAGGVTLFEACALGVPAVALPVAPAQSLTIAAVARAGAAIDAGSFPVDRTAVLRAADAVADLLMNRRCHRRMSDAGRRFVDGRGVFRAAERLRALAGAACHAA
jgi:spore coat polysaccharide biosynthesis predicted glycosyltransferase SpsG